MSTSACLSFRKALELALRGRVTPEDGSARTRELAWHEHLLACGDCQSLLRSEEALEELLASVPLSALPAALAERVLQRLETERVASSEKLDQLLDTSPSPAAPANLGQRILAGLAQPRADDALDALLQRVPEPEQPVGLAARVLRAVESERAAPAHRPWSLLRGGRRWAGAAAIVLTVAAGFAWLRMRSLNTEVVTEDLLSQLEVLENWDYLMSEDLDLFLASLDPAELALLELDADVDEAESEEEDEG